MHFIHLFAAATPLEAILPTVFKDYGPIVGIVVSLITLISAYQKKELKNIEAEIEKNKTNKDIANELAKLNGFMEQFQRENAKNISDINAVLDRLEKDKDSRKYSLEEVHRDHTEIRATLMDLLRDVNRRSDR